MQRQAPLAKFQLAVKDETFWVLGFGLKVLVNPTVKTELGFQMRGGEIYSNPNA